MPLWQAFCLAKPESIGYTAGLRGRFGWRQGLGQSDSVVTCARCASDAEKLLFF
jgi:hypothetical protein